MGFAELTDPLIHLELNMPFVLPPLAYAYNALEPFIDARTMEIHHTKHHQAYINNANAKLEAIPALSSKSAEEIIGELVNQFDYKSKQVKASE